MRFLVAGRRVYFNVRWDEWLVGLTIDEIAGPDGPIGADWCLHVGPCSARVMMRYAIVDEDRDLLPRTALRWFRVGRFWGACCFDSASWCIGLCAIRRGIVMHCGPITTEVLAGAA